MDNRGQFRKGEGGRKKGAVNKVTADVKRLFTELSQEAATRIVERMDEMSNRELISILQAVGKFVVPSLASIDAEVSSNDFQWHQMSKEQKIEIARLYYDKNDE